jgi:hypothetical protein
MTKHSRLLDQSYCVSYARLKATQSARKVYILLSKNGVDGEHLIAAALT